MLRLYLQCDAINGRSTLFDRLQLELVQTIAVIELLLDNWVEPAESSSFDLSTLAHQTISLIAETGGRRAADVYRILVEHGAFRDVDKATFPALLRQLGKADVIDQTPQGELILGLIGEDLRKDKGFYAAFPNSESFVVLYDGRHIGTVDGAPAIEQHMILAGRRWRVTDVDNSGNTVYVVPAHGRNRTPFTGGGGNLHPRIAGRMRIVLDNKNSYAYLNGTAANLLTAARSEAARAGVCKRPLVALDDQTTAIMTWAGTRTTATLRAMLVAGGTDAGGDSVAITVKQPIEEIQAILNKLVEIPCSENSILDVLTAPIKGKYDDLLTPELRREILKRRWLDIPAAMELLRSFELVNPRR